MAALPDAVTTELFVSIMLKAVHPVLVSRHVETPVHFYERLGFRPVFRDSPLDSKYAAIVRDGVELHLQWQDPSQWAHAIDRPTYRFVVDDVGRLGSLAVRARPHCRREAGY